MNGQRSLTMALLTDEELLELEERVSYLMRSARDVGEVISDTYRTLHVDCMVERALRGQCAELRQDV